MLRRVLAVLFGVVVVSIGLSVRSDRRETVTTPVTDVDAAARTADKDPYKVFEDSGVRLLCIEELRDPCEGTFSVMDFTVRIEPAWVTVDRLARGSLGADVWLTARPFDEVAQPEGVPRVLGPASPVLARSPFVLVGPAAAVSAVDAACPDAATRIGCATAAARAPQVALRDPKSSAFGALALATVAHDLGTPADASAVMDAAVVEHIRTLARTGRRTQAPFEDVMRIAGNTVALTVEAEVVEAVDDLDYEQQKTYDKVGIRYPIDVRAAELIAVATTNFRRTTELHAVLQSRAAQFAFDREGFAAEGRTLFVLDDAPIFEARPVVRSDLPASPLLVRHIRRASE